MNRFLVIACLCVAGAGQMPGATVPIYLNLSPLTAPPAIAPQIDAGAFVNQAEFNVTSFSLNPIPFETLNTRYFTNTAAGVMGGDPGFRFDFFTNNVRRSMDWWVNQGTIEVDNSLGGFFIGIVPGVSLLGNWLLVDSDNISVSGQMGAGVQGLLRLQGDNIQIRRTGLRTGQPRGGFTFFGGVNFVDGDYINDLGISDIYWGAGTNNALDDSGTPVQLDLAVATNGFFFGENFVLPNPLSPVHQVIQGSQFSSFTFTNVVNVPSFLFLGTNFFFANHLYDAFVFTNQINATSAVIQVAFVPTNSPDTNFSVDVSFIPDFFGDNGATVVVGFRMFDFDIVTRQLTTNSLYLIDSHAFETNVFLGNNLEFPSQRPSTFIVTRESLFGFGSPTNSGYSPSLLWNPSYATNIVDVSYAGYAVGIIPPTQNDAVGSINPALSHPTNFSGRVEIIGDKVDLDRTRIRSESTIIIRAKDLSSNGVAQVEAPFLVYDLGTTEPVLTVTNLAPRFVRRMSGSLSAWSATWDNQVISLATNLVMGTNVISTNVLDLQFHVLVVDPVLQTLQPVVLTEFAASATNLVLGDFLQISRSMRLSGQTLQVSSGVTLPPSAEWAATNVVGFLNLTNDGRITVSSAAFFGSDRERPYASIVNRGSISASSQFIDTEYLEVAGSAFTQGSGSLIANGGALQVNALTGRLTNSHLVAKSDVIIEADSLLVERTVLQAGASNGFGSLVLSVTNRLCDNPDCDGLGLAGNRWASSTGFRVQQRPVTSDLLGTTITSFAPAFRESVHVWAAEDRGNRPEGFTNNLALGKLILDGGDFTLFSFSGAGASKALYVDFLEFRNNATNYNGTGLVEPSLDIDPSLTIYFADSNILPEKLTNGIHGSRLQWVSDFTGPSSSTNITYPSGEVYTFNLGLVRSGDLDSDGDGIVNAQDPTPLFVMESIGVGIELGSTAPLSAVVSWNALFRSTNTLEYATSLFGGGWLNLTSFVQGSSTSRVSVQDRIIEGEPRYYRVRVDPSGP